MPSKKTKDEARIERLFRERCSGVQIDIMNIGRVFNAGHAAIRNGATDEELGDTIASFVATIREN